MKSDIYTMLETAVGEYVSPALTDNIINAIHREMNARGYVFYQP